MADHTQRKDEATFTGRMPRALWRCRSCGREAAIWSRFVAQIDHDRQGWCTGAMRPTEEVPGD